MPRELVRAIDQFDENDVYQWTGVPRFALSLDFYKALSKAMIRVDDRRYMHAKTSIRSSIYPSTHRHVHSGVLVGRPGVQVVEAI